MIALAAFVRRLVLMALPATACLAGQATVTRPDTLREQPSSFAGRIMDIQRRTAVEVLEVRQEWLRVQGPGNRSGWILRHNTDLDAQPPALVDTPSTAPAPLPASAGRALPSGSPRASNHALLVGGDAVSGMQAHRLAGLMGVPDANLRSLPADDLRRESLRRALADLDGRMGDGDRLLIHITLPKTASGKRRACPDGIPSVDAQPAQAFSRQELVGAVSTLSRRSDKLFLVIDSPSPASGACPPSRLGGGERPALPANLLAFMDGGGGVTATLLTCLEDEGPAFADGEALRRCMQARQHNLAPQLAGNGTLVPVVQAPRAPRSENESASRLLELLHAQRDLRSTPDVHQIASRDGGLRFRLGNRGPVHAYVLAVTTDQRLALLHPNRNAPDTALEAGQTLELASPADATLVPSPRLLLLLSDAPRSPLRAGFRASGDAAMSGNEAVDLQRVIEELLGGDSSPLCRFSETRNLGSSQARQCSTRFIAKWITVAPGKDSR